MCDMVVKKFTSAISSPDEFLFVLVLPVCDRSSTALTSDILQDRRRFEWMLQSTAEEFNPVPAAACLLDATLSAVLMEPDQATLLHAAKMYAITECGSITGSADTVTEFTRLHLP